MNEEEVRQLIERVALGIASDEELTLYNRVYNAILSEEDEAWNEAVLGDKEELSALIRETVLNRTAAKRRVIYGKWIRRVAAVLLVGLMGTAVYMLSRKEPSNQSVSAAGTNPQERYQNDVAPGQVGAILKLSGNKTIVLDSATNGLVAEEHGIEIIKKNGELQYKARAFPGEVVYNTVTTPRGRQFNLVLPDGSKVWLNAASSITYPTFFSGTQRHVTVSGEVYFEVAHNSQKPFIVQQGEMQVQVTGTHFNINSYADERSTKVTLLEGSVNVSQGSRKVGLKPGQQSVIRGNRISVVNDANLAAVMAWKNGYFNFDGADINVLMRQLARWYDVDVEFDRKVGELFFAEIPRNTNLSDVLKALELTGKVRFGIAGRKITVYP